MSDLGGEGGGVDHADMGLCDGQGCEQNLRCADASDASASFQRLDRRVAWAERQPRSDEEAGVPYNSQKRGGEKEAFNGSSMVIMI